MSRRVDETEAIVQAGRPEREIRIGVSAALLSPGGGEATPELDRLGELAVLLPIPIGVERAADHSRRQLAKTVSLGLNGVLLATGTAKGDSRGENTSTTAQSRPAEAFALALRRSFPLLPVLSLSGLREAGAVEEFVERALLHESWLRLLGEDPTPSGLRRFHAEHRLEIMVRSPRHFRELGRKAAKADGRSWESLVACYGDTLAEAMELPVRGARREGLFRRLLGILRNENESYAVNLDMRSQR